MDARRTARALRAAARVLVLAALAAAPAPVAAAPDDVVARPLVLDRGEVEASLALEVELGIRHVGAPMSLAPDVAVGVHRDVTIGIVHSARGLSQIDAGRGLCWRGDEHGCDRAYDNAALDVRWSLQRGALTVAARSRFIIRSFDPWRPRLGLGAVARWSRSRFGITADPSLSLGLASRERGNRAALDVPLWLAVQPTCRWAVHLRTGVHGTLATFGDAYEIPVGLGVTAVPHRRVDVAVEAAFQRLLGPLNDVKSRAMWLAVTVRWP
jgi:hypothetical protein